MKKQRGFTLLELLVVLAIIGIMASMVLVSLQSVRAKARDARRMSDVRQLLMAIELYLDSHLKYPEKGAVGLVDSLPSNLSPYLTTVPLDPGVTPPTCLPEGYRWWGNTGQAKKYCLWTCLEQGGAFTASPSGTIKLDSPPSDLDCQ